MKKVFLKKLAYSNWRGQTQSFEFGNFNILSGRNESGKSTALNAFLWLMVGTDDHNRVNYKLFNVKLPQTYENCTTAHAEALITINGQEFLLAKDATPGWTRKRGQSVYEKKMSDDYKFFIDGIAYSPKEYKKFIESNIAPLEKLKLMLNTQQYTLLDWKELRENFDDLISDIHIDGDYSSIKDLLEKYNYDTDNIRNILKAQINTIKDVMGTENKKGILEVKIETLRSNLPDISGIGEWRERENEISEKLNIIKAQLIGLSDRVKPFIEQRNKELTEIGKLEDDADKARTAYIKAYNDKVIKLKDEIAEVDAYNKDAERFNMGAENEFATARKQIAYYEKQLEVLNDTRLKLLEENKKVKSLVFEVASCPYCGQPLPEDKLEAERNKFNQNKERQHQTIVEQGKANNIRIENIKAQIAKLQELINAGCTQRQYKDKSELEKKLNDLTASYIPYEETADCVKRMDVITQKTSCLTVVPKIDNTVLQEEEKKLSDELVSVRVKLGEKNNYDRLSDKIATLENELKANAMKLAELEGKLFKVNEYDKEKAECISNDVNKYFKYIHIDMTQQKKDGGLVNTCVIKDKGGVDALVTNTANVCLAGLDLSVGLQKFYGISLPLFIDDSDLINEENYPNLDGCQVIKLHINRENLKLEVLC